MIVGNVSVEVKGAVLELTIHTHHKGHPHALLTPGDVIELVSVLKAEAGKIKSGKGAKVKSKAPVPEVELEEDDWKSLI